MRLKNGKPFGWANKFGGRYENRLIHPTLKLEPGLSYRAGAVRVEDSKTHKNLVCFDSGSPQPAVHASPAFHGQSI